MILGHEIELNHVPDCSINGVWSIDEACSSAHGHLQYLNVS